MSTPISLVGPHCHASELPEGDFKYQAGFGNHFATEALPDALPKDQNGPQVCPYGLYAEQLTGTAFTAPRAKNLRSWLYRIRPSVGHSRLLPLPHAAFNRGIDDFVADPNQFRWDPLPLLGPSDGPRDFVDGLVQICGSGEIASKNGLIIYQYAANTSMNKRVFYNSDGDFLIVPQIGALTIRTEFGNIKVVPCEIAVVQRGIKFSVDVLDGDSCRGYVLEILKGHFELPGLGPIGSNGLANPRDFQTPVASFVDDDTEHVVVNKFLGKFFTCTLPHSPFDVVAWHGNYAPYKYDLRKFNTMNSVSFDHPDPSIYTVLTCPSDEPGTAIADFVIFPPRWMVMEKSFRPPFYHRNTMTEYMGMIWGNYDAKAAGAGGFVPGGSSLHSCMTSHGPDEGAFLSASTAELLPHYFNGGLAFMFETCLVLKLNPDVISTAPSSDGLTYPPVQPLYTDCWRKLPKIFDGTINPTFPAPPARGGAASAAAGASGDGK